MCKSLFDCLCVDCLCVDCLGVDATAKGSTLVGGLRLLTEPGRLIKALAEPFSLFLLFICLSRTLYQLLRYLDLQGRVFTFNTPTRTPGSSDSVSDSPVSLVDSSDEM
jgi:hypothetical protein